MRVAIDLLIAEKEPGGMLFAAQALLAGLAKIDQLNEYIVITGRPETYLSFKKISNIRTYPVKLWSWRGITLQHQLLLPDVLRRLNPDLLHIPAFAAPIGWRGPLVITIHDLAFLKMPEQSSIHARLYWQYLLKESAQRAQRIIAVSEQTRQELISLWAIQQDRIHVIHNALRPSLLTTVITTAEIQMMRRRYGGRYLLHVGRIMPRKNVEKLVDAFNLLATNFTDLHLVLTGGAGYDSAEVLQRIQTSPACERIHLVGWVSDQDLARLYASASALVFPSKHEGFGLPVLEAMFFGIPVIASPDAASQEVAGNAVVRVDCSDARLLAEAIGQVLTDSALRESMISLGNVEVQRFSVEACANATRTVYQEALGGVAGLAQPNPAS